MVNKHQNSNDTRLPAECLITLGSKVSSKLNHGQTGVKKTYPPSPCIGRENKKTVLLCCVLFLYVCLLSLLLINVNNKCFFARVVLKLITKNNLFCGNAKFLNDSTVWQSLYSRNSTGSTSCIKLWRSIPLLFLTKNTLHESLIPFLFIT